MVHGMTLKVTLKVMFGSSISNGLKVTLNLSIMRETC